MKFSSVSLPTPPFLSREIQTQIAEGLSTVSVFWFSMVAFQRLAGAIQLHAGLPTPFTAICGISIVTTSHFISHSYASQLSSLIQSGSLKKQSNQSSKTDVLMRRNILNSLAFMVIGRSLFRATLPSSVIAKGAFARPSASVLATSEVATSSQRNAIQRLGVLHGCHQCGDRQLLRQMYRSSVAKTPNMIRKLVGTKGFIADHMPPTLFVNKRAKSSSFFTKLFSSKSGKSLQRLYPQCVKCFSVQGQHVKANSHHMIYYYRPMLVHLSPLLAAQIDSNWGEEIDNLYDSIKELL